MSPSEPSVNAGQNTGMSFYLLAPFLVQSYLGCPIINRRWIINFCTKSMNNSWRRPWLYWSNLFIHHCIQYRHDPIFEFAVVIIGHKKIAYSIETLFAKIWALEMKITKYGWSQTLDQVFLHSTGSSYNTINQFVFCKEANRLSQTRRYEIGRVAKKNLALCFLSDLRI